MTPSPALSADESQACVDCGQQPPATETNYTLISARHGWRLSRTVDEKGQRAMKWRCPECWRKFRTIK
jgi:DNA-directed RNA polymerase subunit RPC12/RpoP